MHNPLCLIKPSFQHISVVLLAPSPILFTIVSQYMEMNKMNKSSQLNSTHSGTLGEKYIGDP
jgi:hypothetical protein